MPKFFKNFPDGFEQYNPEDYSTDLGERETRDKNGELHSFNDEPSQVFSDPEEEDTMNFLWHSHGKLYREDNKPVFLGYERDAYFTLGSNRRFKVYSEKPSRISYDSYNNVFYLSYYENEGLHRENGLPAQLIISPAGTLETKFYEDNNLHRGNNLPANIEEGKQEWVIKGCRHRDDGPAIQYEKPSPNTDKWILFGVRFSQRQFNSLKVFQMEKDIPLWLAFLYGLKLVTESDVDSFLGNNLHKELPLEWSFKSLGITEEKFRDAVIDWRKFQVSVMEADVTLQEVLEVIRFSESERN